MDLNLSDDFGWINVTIGDVTARLDLYRVDSRLNELIQIHGANHVALGDAWVAYIQELGFPQVSHYVATKLVTGITKAISELKKKDQPASTASASLVGSTASPSSP